MFEQVFHFSIYRDHPLKTSAFSMGGGGQKLDRVAVYSSKTLPTVGGRVGLAIIGDAR